ncbi:uncharacterized protein C8Q71DRAFT_298259 [Rhodofomes roseus]|uniref:Uncharacterized protein n=1 Tax=Rhodofomes roseus TaxID=34475 RepID=A0ABQ8K3D8_9APHY|nr:uncharacterized protein C8Q71DRAFT_298259 [Rhodofomes roseus]KAH9831332.1 hypothetical protein C8Q71DRAFT_298259 [Rhodofomes roseus]
MLPVDHLNEGVWPATVACARPGWHLRVPSGQFPCSLYTDKVQLRRRARKSRCVESEFSCCPHREPHTAPRDMSLQRLRGFVRTCHSRARGLISWMATYTYSIRPPPPHRGRALLCHSRCRRRASPRTGRALALVRRPLSLSPLTTTRTASTLSPRRCEQSSIDRHAASSHIQSTVLARLPRQGTCQFGSGRWEWRGRTHQ